MKDFVVRGKSMLGYDVPFVPGWDCHGLPIEHKVATDLGNAARTMEPLKIRRKCKTYAEKQIKLQRKQLQRLLTVADYDDPYLTMNPRYEGATLDVFATLVERGLVYRGLKPVHWSIENQTALADAELEYEDRTDPSIYVRFEAVDDPTRSFMIWTTTPWTLPANLAIAVHPDSTYGLYPLGDTGESVMLAVELAPKVLPLGGYEAAEPVQTFRGEELVGLTYRHPFLDRVGKILPADYVTLEDGTGLVHTAPGHGTEDYQTGLAQGLDVYCPVRADGTYDDTTPDWLQGQLIWDANPAICERLVADGHMFLQHDLDHSYPHDWRGKGPVIFRATEQWFVDVNKAFYADAADVSLKQRALDVTADAVRFLPAWGKNRMRGMLETRPDWCLSRQRAWGLPIPAFYAQGEAEPLLTPASVRAVAQAFREDGSDSWFTTDPTHLLRHYDPAGDPDAPAWAKQSVANATKSTDIFDVWFESGSSWHSVMQQRFGPDCHPNDLYLEGSDQHRGWFQLSLLTSLAGSADAQPPFKQVLTHGFMVNKDGKKLSKSAGDTVDQLFDKHGADVLRWWVSTLNTDNDMKVDEAFFTLAGEQYRKIRNTLRFLLSNLGDVDPTTLSLADLDPTSLDAWALGELDTLFADVTAAYDALAFRKVSDKLFGFCNETLSAVYLTAMKDRLYCDAPDSPPRRQNQAAQHAIAHTQIQLIGPVHPHTADEALAALTGDTQACAALLDPPQPTGVAPASAWAAVMQQRDTWLKALEDFRQAHRIDNPLDLGLTAPPFVEHDTLDPAANADLLGISPFAFGPPHPPPALSAQPPCDRCWKRDGTVQQYTWEGHDVHLAARDAAVLGVS